MFQNLVLNRIVLGKRGFIFYFNKRYTSQLSLIKWHQGLTFILQSPDSWGLEGLLMTCRQTTKQHYVRKASTVLVCSIFIHTFLLFVEHYPVGVNSGVKVSAILNSVMAISCLFINENRMDVLHLVRFHHSHNTVPDIRKIKM